MQLLQYLKKSKKPLAFHKKILLTGQSVEVKQMVLTNFYGMLHLPVFTTINFQTPLPTTDVVISCFKQDQTEA